MVETHHGHVQKPQDGQLDDDGPRKESPKAPNVLHTIIVKRARDNPSVLDWICDFTPKHT